MQRESEGFSHTHSSPPIYTSILRELFMHKYIHSSLSWRMCAHARTHTRTLSKSHSHALFSPDVCVYIYSDIFAYILEKRSESFSNTRTPPFSTILSSSVRPPCIISGVHKYIQVYVHILMYIVYVYTYVERSDSCAHTICSLVTDMPI